MIVLTTALKSLLNGTNVYCVADLYTFFLSTGAVLRYSSSDINLSWGGQTYTGLGLAIDRSKIKQSKGIQVDDLTVTVYPSPHDEVGADPILQMAVNGGLDGCYVQLDRAFLASWSTPVVGIVPKRFYGRIAGLQAGRSKIDLNIKSDLDLMNIQMPRVLFQPGCSHSLYDGGCTLHKADFTVTGHVTAVTDATTFQTSISNPAGYMVLGVLTFTSGVNDGLSGAVKTDNGSGALSFQIPFPVAPSIGDTFTVYRGCAKTQSACNTFSNIQNFRGFPYIPAPETALT